MGAWREVEAQRLRAWQGEGCLAPCQSSLEHITQHLLLGIRRVCCGNVDARLRCQSPGCLTIFEACGIRARQSGEVGKQAAILAVANEQTVARNIARQHRDAGGHGFCDAVAEPLVLGGVEHEIGFAQCRQIVLVRQAIVQMNAATEIRVALV